MLLSDIYTVDRIKVNLKSKTRTELFYELTDFLVAKKAISEPGRVIEALSHRENVMSTVLVPNIAIPHASLWLFKDTVGVFGVSKEGIDYGAPDGKPVHIVMLLVDDRYDANKHLVILKNMAKLIGAPNFYSRIMECDNPKDVNKLMLEIEELYHL